MTRLGRYGGWIATGMIVLVSTAFAQPVQRAARVKPEVHHDTSIPLREMPPAPRAQERKLHPVLPLPRHGRAGVTDPVVQSALVPLAPTSLQNFAGVGNGFTGPAGAFDVNQAPSDANGSVGPNHYVQTVNTDFAIFNKNGTVIYGPVAINTLWTGFPGGCATNNDGDPVVLYDKIADRWVISQFSVSTTPYLECVAVSQTPDPSGAWNRYSFSYDDFPDYPKMGVWPDAYYITFNGFGPAGSSFTGSQVCAYDRTKMLAGQAATQQCFTADTSFSGLLPADLDGQRQPPAGSPNYLLSLGATDQTLAYWKFHVDWNAPANTTFTGPTLITTAAYALPCGGAAGACVPQLGTTQQLDALGDRLMFRLAYRNFADGHQSLVANHSVTAGSSIGVRWYELRADSNNNLSLFQSGTYAPDSNYRWMGSIAMDQGGNIALGFSVSGPTINPGIHYTGRLASDALGVMSQGEATIIDGGGAQSGPTNLTRWGDYSAMSVDPSDDCTFWYTNQYIPTTGEFNWSTRIGSFNFPGCSNDFSIAANPSSLSVVQGTSGTSTISTGVISGSAGTVTLSVTGLPSGVTASLSPTSVTAGGSSTLTVSAAGASAVGSYTLTVTGTEGSVTHSTPVTLAVTAGTPDFSISASPNSLSLAPGTNGSSTISTAVTAGSAGTVALTVSGVPSGATASLSSSSVTAGGNSTLNVNVSGVAPGSYTLTVTGTEGAKSHSTTVALTVIPPVPNDFSISATPNSLSLVQGASGTSAIATTITAGHAGTVTLSVAGLPGGATASFSPTSVTAGAGSTLTVSAGTAAPGTYTLTVRGTEGPATHTTTVTLAVTAAPSVIFNGGFETGTLSGWTATGATGISTISHSGSFSAKVGSSSPFNGDSTLSQTFTAPPAGGQLSFWYKVVCTDTVTYDWATATLKDNTTGITTTILPKTCTNNNTWQQASAALVGGHSYTLTLIDHDDNYATDPTYTLFDDVVISTAATGPVIANGGFETGSLSGWTATGATGITTASHSGSFSAVVGSTSPFVGDSTLSQTFTAPAGATVLSFWYRVVCTDTVTYDWATATLSDNTAGTTATVLSKTCTNSGAWNRASAAVTAGHSYTLTLIDHDDGYTGDPTYTLFDDVTLQ